MVKSGKPSAELAKAEAAIARLALAFPEVTEENPWGHRAFKIRGKTFLFLGADSDGVSFSVKLPESGIAALALDFTEPTHYGLGKSGWVTARFPRARDVPLPLVEAWLAESFGSMAPAKLRSGAARAGAKTARAGAKTARAGAKTARAGAKTARAGAKTARARARHASKSSGRPTKARAKKR